MRRVFPPRLLPVALDESSVLMSDSCHLLHSFEIASLDDGVEKDRVACVVLWRQVVLVVVVVVDMERRVRLVKRLAIVVSDAMF